jgi:hypothetical protein
LKEAAQIKARLATAEAKAADFESLQRDLAAVKDNEAPTPEVVASLKAQLWATKRARDALAQQVQEQEALARRQSGKPGATGNWFALLSAVASGKEIPQQEVRKLLGPPDDIRKVERQSRVGGFGGYQLFTVWTYSDGGQVEFLGEYVSQIRKPGASRMDQ